MQAKYTEDAKRGDKRSGSKINYLTESVEQHGASDACLEWPHSINGRGYGNFGENGKSVLVHRRSYQLFVGAIPAGHFICHRCDNPKCYNPRHLFAGTNLDNVLDSVSKKRHKNPALKGEAVSNHKLTEDQVLKIRALRATGHTYRVIAEAFRIHRNYAKLIIKRKRWKHI